MDAFGTVVVAVAVIGGLLAVLSYLGTGKLYQGIGKGQFTFDEPDPRRSPAPGSAAARAEADEELRQLLQAKSDRREMRGEPPLDVDAEFEALRTPAETARDAALVEEVRQLVIASNERRVRRGEEPLDVETEVERQLRELGG
jgi:hypothetical protein